MEWFKCEYWHMPWQIAILNLILEIVVNSLVLTILINLSWQLIFCITFKSKPFFILLHLLEYLNFEFNSSFSNLYVLLTIWVWISFKYAPFHTHIESGLQFFEIFIFVHVWCVHTSFWIFYISMHQNAWPYAYRNPKWV